MSGTGDARWRAGALLPELPWARGVLDLGGVRCEFVRADVHGGLSRVWFLAERAPDRALLLDWAARAGCPLLGDAERGGLACAGGLALREGGLPDWPAESPFAPDASAPPPAGSLPVSRATARVLRRGHPLALADERTRADPRLRAGALVRLVDPAGGRLGLARVDDGRPVVARMWQRAASRPREATSVEERVARALERRRALLERAREPSGTDAFRLLHGEADGLPGAALDRLGPVLRLLLYARCALGFAERALRAVRARPELALPVVEVVQLRSPPPGALECVRVWPESGAAAPSPVWVREGGLHFRVEPGLDDPSRPRPGVGFFLDQREARARVRAAARPAGRYLNLFAHTGGFSAALLAGGAGRVWSVDLSGPYLAWLEENLRRNGLADSRHRPVQRDARRILAELAAGGERFDGIVLDPPTAAAGGRRFFSARRDLAALMAGCLGRLRPGGWLLVSRHDRRGRGRLQQLAERAAAEGGVGPVRCRPARPPRDFPALAGYPEGDPFEALWIERLAAPGGGKAGRRRRSAR